MIKKIFKGIKNRRVGVRSIPIYYSIQDGIWTETSMEVLVALSASDNIDNIYFPTGHSAEIFYKENNDAGILYIDKNIDGKKSREVLPAYMDFIYLNLK